MKNLLRKKKSYKWVFWLVGILALTIGLGAATIAVNGWFESHRLVMRSPVEIRIFKPLWIEERKPEIRVEKINI